MMNIDENLVNEIRERMYNSLISKARIVDPDIKSIEDVVKLVNNDELNKTMLLKPKIENELVPFLKECNIRYSNPSLAGVIYIFFDTFTLSILASESGTYNVQLYYGKGLDSRQVSCKRLGYSPEKNLAPWSGARL
jgi:hypothetical protein